jgi:hypothetical protein
MKKIILIALLMVAANVNGVLAQKKKSTTGLCT